MKFGGSEYSIGTCVEDFYFSKVLPNEEFKQVAHVLSKYCVLRYQCRRRRSAGGVLTHRYFEKNSA